MGEEGEKHISLFPLKNLTQIGGEKRERIKGRVIFLHLDGFQRHKKDKLITTQQRIYPINKDHASTASSYSLVSHYSIIFPSLLSHFIHHLVQVLL